MRKHAIPIILLLVISIGIIIPSSTVKADISVSKPKISVSSNNDSITITISKTTNATGYRIFMKSPNEKKYKKLVTLKQNGTEDCTYTIADAKEGMYYFKAKAYNKKNGKTVWSSYGKAKKITISNTSNKEETKLDFSSLKAGDIVTFGSYEQDKNTSNGSEPIEWIVISNSTSEMLLLSKQALTCMPYNKTKKVTTWENSTLRLWLNDEFYNSAFNDAEKSAIQDTLLINEDYIANDIDGGNDTIDKVFILSSNYIKNADYEFYNGTSASDTLKCVPTKYAKSKGAKTNLGCCTWWLRSCGYNEYSGVIVSYNGMMYCPSYTDKYAIRPAIVVSSSVLSDLYTSGKITIAKPFSVYIYSDGETGLETYTQRSFKELCDIGIFKNSTTTTSNQLISAINDGLENNGKIIDSNRKTIYYVNDKTGEVYLVDITDYKSVNEILPYIINEETIIFNSMYPTYYYDEETGETLINEKKTIGIFKGTSGKEYSVWYYSSDKTGKYEIYCIEDNKAAKSWFFLDCTLEEKASNINNWS